LTLLSGTGVIVLDWTDGKDSGVPAYARDYRRTSGTYNLKKFKI